MIKFPYAAAENWGRALQPSPGAGAKKVQNRRQRQRYFGVLRQMACVGGL